MPGGRKFHWPHLLLGGGLLLALLLGAYWVKSRMGINLFRTFSFSRALYVKAFQTELRRLVPPPRPGVLIHDMFRWPWHSAWQANFWARDAAATSHAYSRVPGPNVPCLFIDNRGQNEWTYVYQNIYPVAAGEVFDYWGRFQADSGVATHLSVGLYARDGRAVDWVCGVSKATGTQGWFVCEREFVIPQGIDSIQFRLCGQGQGRCWFSEVRFRKLASESP